MDETSKKVSLAMPVYNGMEYLAEVLASIEKQTFKDFQLIICDNASTDDTPRICLDYCARNSNFVYLRQATHVNGLDNAIRAYGLSGKQSKYFIFVHDDNIYSEQFLEKLVEHMELNPLCVVCGFCLHYVNEKGQVTLRHYSRIPWLLKKSKLLHFAFEWRSNINTFALHCLMRRSAIDNIELKLDIDDFPERYYIAQLRGLGEFHVIEEDLATFNSGGIGEAKNDPWVRSRVLMKFGQKEVNALLSFRQINALEKFVLAQSLCYVTLRHRVPDTIWRWWLLPAYVAAGIGNLLRPNKWVFEDGASKKKK